MEDRKERKMPELCLEVVRFDNEDVIAASGQPSRNREESNSRFIQITPGGGFDFGSFPTRQ